MGDSPATTNQAATIANKVLHALIFDVAVKAAEAELIAAFPILGAPVIHQLEESLLNIVADKIYVALAQGATFAIIDAQTSLEAAAANRAKDQMVAALQGNDIHAIDIATTNFEQAFERLIHFDGSAHPHP